MGEGRAAQAPTGERRWGRPAAAPPPPAAPPPAPIPVPPGGWGRGQRRRPPIPRFPPAPPRSRISGAAPTSGAEWGSAGPVPAAGPPRAAPRRPGTAPTAAAPLLRPQALTRNRKRPPLPSASSSTSGDEAGERGGIACAPHDSMRQSRHFEAGQELPGRPRADGSGAVPARAGPGILPPLLTLEEEWGNPSPHYRPLGSRSPPPNCPLRGPLTAAALRGLLVAPPGPF